MTDDSAKQDFREQATVRQSAARSRPAILVRRALLGYLPWNASKGCPALAFPANGPKSLRFPVSATISLRRAPKNDRTANGRV